MHYTQETWASERTRGSISSNVQGSGARLRVRRRLRRKKAFKNSGELSNALGDNSPHKAIVNIVIL
ncbi:MAG: hypothetical protein AAB385_08545, partial [Planctomycetota bacterium]